MTNKHNDTEIPHARKKSKRIADQDQQIHGIDTDYDLQSKKVIDASSSFNRRVQQHRLKL
jgi:hypothetical protein